MTSPLLDPVLIARLASLTLRARAVAEGGWAGPHRGRRKGRSSEFSGHRPYVPSDDPRSIDWKAFARTDRKLVREDQEEANRRVVLLLDASASMAYADEGRPSKLRCGAVLLAALAYGFARRGESVGAGLVAQGAPPALPPRGGMEHVSRILGLLEGARARGVAPWADALDAAAAASSRRAWFIVATDLWDDGRDPLPAFRRLRARGHEASVLAVLDPSETALPRAPEALFRGMEAAGDLQVSTEELRGRYRRMAEARLARLAAAFAAAGVPVTRCGTERPLDESLVRFLERHA